MEKTTVHFRGGTYDGKGKHFKSPPADVLVIPVGDGFFERYRRGVGVVEGGETVVVYQFAERFEGER